MSDVGNYVDRAWEEHKVTVCIVLVIDLETRQQQALDVFISNLFWLYYLDEVEALDDVDSEDDVDTELKLKTK